MADHEKQPESDASGAPAAEGQDPDEEAAVETFELYSNFDGRKRDIYCDIKADTFEIELCNKDLTFYQSGSLQTGLGVTGARIWDSAIILSKFIEEHSHIFGFDDPEKRCIELGAGVGMCGIGAALLGSTVVLSDQEHMRDLLERNVRENAPQAYAEGRADVWRFQWGEPPAKEMGAPFDYIICADCVFNEDVVVELMDALQEITDENSLVLFTLELRNEAVYEAFLQKSLRLFQMVRVPQTAWHPNYRCDSVVMYLMRRVGPTRPIGIFEYGAEGVEWTKVGAHVY